MIEEHNGRIHMSNTQHVCVCMGVSTAETRMQPEYSDRKDVLSCFGVEEQLIHGMNAVSTHETLALKPCVTTGQMGQRIETDPLCHRSVRNAHF